VLLNKEADRTLSHQPPFELHMVQ